MAGNSMCEYYLILYYIHKDMLALSIVNYDK